jgi:CBS domain-containing protein
VTEEEIMSQDRPTAVRDALVGDVMSAPVVTCLPGVPLTEVAELMVRHRIHAVVVLADPAGRVEDDEEWGVISELDLVGGACLADPELPAGRVAGTPPVTVSRDESLERAAFLMADYQVTHLIVVEGGRAAGIVSALDVARAMAPEPPAPPPARSDVKAMTASPGDRLVVGPHQLGGQGRDAEILEARGDEGGPPFLVRWEDSGRVSLLYPGSDAHVERTARR